MKTGAEPKVVVQSCLTLCDPMGCNWTGSSVFGIQARKLEWVTMPSLNLSFLGW